MFEGMKKLLGIGGDTTRRQEVQRWCMSQAKTVAFLISVQLKNVGKSQFESWGGHHVTILGYACGMAGHVCAKFNVRKSEPGIALMVLGELTAGALRPDDLFNMLVVVQTSNYDDYSRAHKVGWHDLGTLSPDGLPTGLEALIRDAA